MIRFFVNRDRCCINWVSWGGFRTLASICIEKHAYNEPFPYIIPPCDRLLCQASCRGHPYSCPLATRKRQRYLPWFCRLAQHLSYHQGIPLKGKMQSLRKPQVDISSKLVSKDQFLGPKPKNKTEGDEAGTDYAEPTKPKSGAAKIWANIRICEKRQIWDLRTFFPYADAKAAPF